MEHRLEAVDGATDAILTCEIGRLGAVNAHEIRTTDWHGFEACGSLREFEKRRLLAVVHTGTKRTMLNTVDRIIDARVAAHPRDALLHEYARIWSVCYAHTIDVVARTGYFVIP